MARPAKYPDGCTVNGFTLVQRTKGGTNPKAIFRDASGNESEQFISNVTSGKFRNIRETYSTDGVQPGDMVGDAGIVFIKWTENSRALFRHVDGTESEHFFSNVALNKVRGPKRQKTEFVVGQPMGSNGLILASVPNAGKALFKHPSGDHRTHRVIDVQRGVVTGRRRGRPQGVLNNEARTAERFDFKSIDENDTSLKPLRDARKLNDKRRKERNLYQQEWRRKRAKV
jgi:hypothetical protein